MYHSSPHTDLCGTVREVDLMKSPIDPVRWLAVCRVQHANVSFGYPLYDERHVTGNAKITRLLVLPVEVQVIWWPWNYLLLCIKFQYVASLNVQVVLKRKVVIFCFTSYCIITTYCCDSRHYIETSTALQMTLDII